MRPHGYEFDFVISYASENELFAENLREDLITSGANVFFAPDYEADLWGKNLFEFLENIYSEKGRFCILIVSQDYVRKRWTAHEWRSAQQRVLRIDDDYILPIRLDDTDLPGLPIHKAFIDARKSSAKEIAGLALKKLRIENTISSSETGQKKSTDRFTTDYDTKVMTGWIRTGALFWISYDLQWTYIELMQGGSPEQINRGLRQCYHHTRRLNLEQPISDRMFKLMIDGAHYVHENEWTVERRNQFGSEIRDIFNKVGKLAEENENHVTADGFDAGAG